MARSLKFWIEVEKGLWYLSSKNKGGDQLCSFCTADLHLCFIIGKMWLSHDAANVLFSTPDSVYTICLEF